MSLNFNMNNSVNAWDDVLASAFFADSVDLKFVGQSSLRIHSKYEPDLTDWHVVQKHTVFPPTEKDKREDYYYRLANDQGDQVYLRYSAIPGSNASAQDLIDSLTQSPPTPNNADPDSDDDSINSYLFMEITCGSRSENRPQEIIRHFIADSAYIAPEIDEEEVQIGFWRMTGQGPYCEYKRMFADPWEDIKQNYADSVSDGLNNLMKITGDQIAGKLLLLYGPPGTGKTSSLRTLARAWQEWCNIEVVIDPDRMFMDADYLMSVLAQSRNTDKRKWTMLLLEDCDELIGTKAKQTGGQAMSRLLNATDGFLGQGQNLLVGITTNEPINDLHPAVLRPGRCLATLEVPELSFKEAAAWLNDPILVGKLKDGEPATLAELYAIKFESGVIESDEEEEQVHGLYM